MTTNTDRARLEYEAVAQLDYAMAEAADVCSPHSARWTKAREAAKAAIDALAASPAAPSGDVPELPSADFYISVAVPEDTPVYTADDMRDFWRQGYAAGRASAAPVEAVRWEVNLPTLGWQITSGQEAAKDLLAQGWEIRALGVIAQPNKD